MITNLPSNIEKRIDSVYISLPINKMSEENVLKGIIPSTTELETQGSALLVRLVPGDGGIDLKQRESKSGNYWANSFSFDVVTNSHVDFPRLNFFSNKKVTLVINSTTHRYLVGTKDQPLDFSFIENTDGFVISISGDTYYPAVRQQNTSFRSIGV